MTDIAYPIIIVGSTGTDAFVVNFRFTSSADYYIYTTTAANGFTDIAINTIIALRTTTALTCWIACNPAIFPSKPIIADALTIPTQTRSKAGIDARHIAAQDIRGWTVDHAVVVRDWDAIRATSSKRTDDRCFW